MKDAVTNKPNNVIHNKLGIKAELLTGSIGFSLLFNERPKPIITPA
jgi:hypothetical protein